MKRFIKKNILLLFLGIILIGLLSGCTADRNILEFSEDKDEGSLVLYVFWGEGCAHCEDAKEMLEELDDIYPTLNIRSFEIWYDEENSALFTQMADFFNMPEGGRGTPAFFLNDRYWVGFSDPIAEEIKANVDSCNQTGCPDAGGGIMPGATGEMSKPGPVITDTSEIVKIPLIGKVYLSQQSVWISTILIAIVDGVNPCSIWVLTMLLALTLHTGSRKKVIIIGIVFTSVTAIIYALFITGLFTILSIVSFIGWIQIVMALMAFFFGVINMKDYFWYKEGVSLTIKDNKKPGLFQRMRKLVDASQSFWGLAGATVVMAAGVSLIEFSCTAGFPVLWTNLLVSQKTTAGVFIALLILYMLIYQLDELVIFFASVFTLKASRLEEKHGRILKLIGGTLMLTLAFVMLVNPNWMNSLSKSLMIFAIAFGLAGLILIIHRRILPAFGIWIGSEAKNHKTKKSSKKRKKRH